MKAQLLVATFAIMIVACKPSAGELPAKTHDGRGGTACPDSTTHPAVQLCSPSLIRLVTRGEDYDGQQLRVSGHLRKGDTVFYLCPAQGLCEEDDWSAAVQLPSSSAISEMERNGELPSRRVTVIGKFSATTRGRAGQVAGVFLSVDTAYFSRGP